MTETTVRRKSNTRDRILDLAEESVLQKGVAATSIDELIVGVGITKSGFFYHFRDKGELAKALLQRYLDREDALLNELFARAADLHEDPLHSFLIGLKMFAETMEEMPDLHPGCLIASFCYQEQLFNLDVRELNRSGVLAQRKWFRDRLNAIVEVYPPRIDVDLDALADMVPVVIDGGIIISRVLKDKHLLAQQVMLYREFVRAIFLGV